VAATKQQGGCGYDYRRPFKGLARSEAVLAGDIEKRTGLLRCYVSRVENGHTVPAVETLEKMARALEVPMYELFYDGEEPPAPLELSAKHQVEWGRARQAHRYLSKLCRLLVRMQPEDRKLLLYMTQRMVSRKR
jgi:transcriptional regulator with XRE-family HTH domain